MDLRNVEWRKRTEKKADDYKALYQKQGMAGLSNAISCDLNGWKNEKINIAVLGQSGTGKSSFINAMLELNSDDEGAAAVDCTENAIALHFYKHPRNKKIIIWDFPGVGTKTFPKEEYLALADFRKFDFFILLTSKRFTEIDIWLAHATEMTRKSFYFVRTQFGNDLENECRKRRKIEQSEIEANIRAKVFEDCRKNLEIFNCEDRIFIIDSYEKNCFDFRKLEEMMINDAMKISETKQVSMALSLSTVTKSAIQEKKVILEERIPKVALRAAFAQSLQCSDVGILDEEHELYRNQFHLDPTSLEEDIRVSSIREKLSEIELNLYHTETQSPAYEQLTNEVDILISYLFPFIDFVKTYAASKLFLKKSLDNIVETVGEMNETMIRELLDK